MQLGSRSTILLVRDLRQSLAHGGGRCMPQVRHPQPQPPPHKVYRSSVSTDVVPPVVDIVLVDLVLQLWRQCSQIPGIYRYLKLF